MNRNYNREGAGATTVTNDYELFSGNPVVARESQLRRIAMSVQWPSYMSRCKATTVADKRGR